MKGNYYIKNGKFEMDGEVYCFRNTKTDKKLGYKNF
jgi:hypothetical protein